MERIYSLKELKPKPELCNALSEKIIYLKKKFFQAISTDFIIKISQTFGTRIILIFLALIINVIVSRALGPEGRGLYAVAITVGSVGVQLGNLGLHASNTYFVAKNPEWLPKLLSNSLLFGFCFGGLISLIIWIFFLFVPGFAPLSSFLLLLALLWIPLGLAYLLLQNLLIGIQDISSYNKIDLITRILTLALLVIALFFNLIDIQIYLIIGIISVLMAFIFSLKTLSKHVLKIPFPSFILVKKGFQYGFKAYLAALFSFLVIRSDIFIVLKIIGEEAAGYYSLAVSLIDMIYILPVVVGNMLFPILSSMDSIQEKWLFTKKVTIILSYIMVIITFSSLLFGRFLIKLLYGIEYLPATEAFYWLLPAVIFLSINTIFTNYFASIGMPYVTVYSPFIAFIVNLILNLLLIPKIGIIGASISSTIAYSAMFIFSILYIRKGTNYEIRLSEEAI